MFNSDWITCTKYYNNHLRLDSQSNWGSLYDYFMRTRVTTLIINKTFTRAPKLWWKCITSLSCCYQMFHSNNSQWHCFTRILLIFQVPIYLLTSFYETSFQHLTWHVPASPNIVTKLNNVVWLRLGFGFGFANHLMLNSVLHIHQEVGFPGTEIKKNEKTKTNKRRRRR